MNQPRLRLQFQRLPKPTAELTTEECTGLLRRHKPDHWLATASLTELQTAITDSLLLGELTPPELPKRGFLPTKGRESDAGIDIYSDEDVVLPPAGKHHTPAEGWPDAPIKIVKTGIASQIPEGYAAILRDRSSVGSKGVNLHAGVIDCEYRGEWLITLVNHHTKPYHIKRGDKICQAILVAVPPVDIVETGQLDESDRGTRGFGSSGK